jgi:hypothetical protein
MNQSNPSTPRAPAASSAFLQVRAGGLLLRTPYQSFDLKASHHHQP